MLRSGDKAPSFAGPSGDGTRLVLEDFRGKPLVLYFYPKDNTPTCTKEACSFRDQSEELAGSGAAVVGVSCDTPETHARFAEGQRLNFPLLSDTDGSIAKAYGVARLGGILGGWIPPRRVTFVIDGEGVVREVIQAEFDAVRHVEGAIAAVRALTGTNPAP